LHQSLRERSGRPWRKRPEQGASLRHPAEALLEDSYREIASDQVPNGQGSQRSVCGEICAQEHSRRVQLELPEGLLQDLRRYVNDGG
jgi:hypothetical protein